MSRRGAALLLAGGAILAACNMLDPFPTTPGAASPGAAAVPRVAICYNAMTTPLAAVQTEAQRECAPGTIAEPAETDWHLQHCPLLLPARATFVCMPRR